MGGLFRVYWGFTARWRSRTQISHSNWALLVGTGQVGQGIRSHVGWGQGRLLGAGWFRHGSYLSGQRHFLGEVSIERRTRWQAWREREGLKAGHATGGWYLWNWAKTERLWGNRHCSSRGSACYTVLGRDTWFKEAGTSHADVPLWIQRRLAQHLSSGHLFDQPVNIPSQRSRIQKRIRSVWARKGTAGFPLCSPLHHLFPLSMTISPPSLPWCRLHILQCPPTAALQ